jgi:hypothetical protein
MTYKNRLISLVVIIGLLVFALIGNAIYNLDRGTASEIFAWLDVGAARNITRIALSTEWDEFELIRRNELWLINHNGNEVPARQLRVADFLSILTTGASWPVRSSNVSSYEHFGLDDSASRVTVYGEHSVILELLIGKDDVMGLETYFLKTGQSDVRSGDNSIKAFMANAVTGWYNFRIIPESESGLLDSGTIQRFSVNNGEQTYVFTRNYMGWDISGIDISVPDVNNIENYIRTIINTEGDNFVYNISRDDPIFNHSRIVLEFGNGRILTIRISEPNNAGRRLVNITGREYIYSLPAWAGNRLFMDPSSFGIP